MIARKAYSKLLRHLSKKEYSILTGARQTGKSTILRHADGNEVDFVCQSGPVPKAIEVKYDKQQVNRKKYKVFEQAYPDIPLSFLWMQPFDEDFFRLLNRLTTPERHS